MSTGSSPALAPPEPKLLTPSSPRRIAASRANGRLSLGPKTSQGRQNSAASNRKHGYYTQTPPQIDPSELASLVEEFQPQTNYQLLLIHVMANTWTLERHIQALQTAQLNTAIALVDPTLPAPVRAVIAFRNISDESDSLLLAHRLEARYSRQYDRALAALEKSYIIQKMQFDPNPTISTAELRPSSSGPTTQPIPAIAKNAIDPNPKIENYKAATNTSNTKTKVDPNPTTAHQPLLPPDPRPHQPRSPHIRHRRQRHPILPVRQVLRAQRCRKPMRQLLPQRHLHTRIPAQQQLPVVVELQTVAPKHERGLPCPYAHNSTAPTPDASAAPQSAPSSPPVNRRTNTPAPHGTHPNHAGP